MPATNTARTIHTTVRFRNASGAPASDYAAMVIERSLRLEAASRLGLDLWNIRLTADEADDLADGRLTCAGGSVIMA